MRCAWRVSLSKFDIHGRHAEPPAGTSALQKLICLGLLLIALYPVPGWFGYPVPAAPESLQIFIDSITKPYFRFFADRDPDHDVAQGFDHRLVQAEGWLQAGHQHHQTQDCAGDFCVSCFCTAASRSRAITFSTSATVSAISAKPDPKASKLDLCTPAEVGLCTRAADGTLPDTCTKLCAVKTEFDTRNACTSTKVKVFAAQTYTFEISKKDEWSFLGAPSGPGGMPLSEFWHHKDDGWLGSAVALAQMAALSAAYPIRRTFDRPFGRVITRYGDTGNTENFIDTRDDPRTVEYLRETFKPANDGELYVYLNKPVSGFWPGLFRDVKRERQGFGSFVFRTSELVRIGPQTTRPPKGGLSSIRQFAIRRKIWSGRRGSNPRPRPWQGRALPLSYTRIRDGGERSPSTADLCQMRTANATVRMRSGATRIIRFH